MVEVPFDTFPSTLELVLLFHDTFYYFALSFELS
mgnify:FL=1